MYLDLKKLAQRTTTIAGLLLLGFGIVSYIFSATVTEQIAATLNAILGLMVIWFISWLRANTPSVRPKAIATPQSDRNPTDPSRRRVT